MIELKITGNCKNCPYMQLTFSDINGVPEMKCKHEKICMRLIDRFLKDELVDENVCDTQ